MEIQDNANAVNNPKYIPIIFPKIPISNPTGARDFWYTDATIGAVTTPPILAWLLVAIKNIGTFNNLPPINKIAACIVIQHIPTSKNTGAYKIEVKFFPGQESCYCLRQE